jgi:hypothetical protein
MLPEPVGLNQLDSGLKGVTMPRFLLLAKLAQSSRARPGEHVARASASQAAGEADDMKEEVVYYTVGSEVAQVGIVVAPNKEAVLAKLRWLASKPGTVVEVIELRTPEEADAMGLEPSTHEPTGVMVSGLSVSRKPSDSSRHQRRCHELRVALLRIELDHDWRARPRELQGMGRLGTTREPPWVDGTS